MHNCCHLSDTFKKEKDSLLWMSVATPDLDLLFKTLSLFPTQHRSLFPPLYPVYVCVLFHVRLCEHSFLCCKDYSTSSLSTLLLAIFVCQLLVLVVGSCWVSVYLFFMYTMYVVMLCHTQRYQSLRIQWVCKSRSWIVDFVSEGRWKHLWQHLCCLLLLFLVKHLDKDAEYKVSFTAFWFDMIWSALYCLELHCIMCKVSWGHCEPKIVRLFATPFLPSSQLVSLDIGASFSGCILSSFFCLYNNNVSVHTYLELACQEVNFESRPYCFLLSFDCVLCKSSIFCLCVLFVLLHKMLFAESNWLLSVLIVCLLWSCGCVLLCICICCTVCSRAKGRNDHTNMTAPLPVCSAKLSMFGPG